MEVEKLSFTEFMSRLKVGQFWAVIVIVTGLIAGAFAAGYKTHATVNEAKLNKYDLKEAELNRDLRDLKEHASELDATTKVLREEHRFLKLYLRFEQAHRKDYAMEGAENVGEPYPTFVAFDEYLSEREDAEKIRVGKGSARNAVVKLSDGSEWKLPESMTAAAKK